MLLLLKYLGQLYFSDQSGTINLGILLMVFQCFAHLAFKNLSTSTLYFKNLKPRFRVLAPDLTLTIF